MHRVLAALDGCSVLFEKIIIPYSEHANKNRLALSAPVFASTVLDKYQWSKISKK